MKTINDIILWDLIQNKGSAKAFAELYERYWKQLYTTVYWRVCDEDITKDIVQDIFVTLWEKRVFIHIEYSLEGYLKVAARNRVLNYFKSEEARVKHYQAVGVSSHDAAHTPVEIIAAKELSESFRKEVEQLPEKMRKIFLMNKENGLSIEEIARNLSLSQQTVKNQLTSALKKVRLRLAQQ